MTTGLFDPRTGTTWKAEWWDTYTGPGVVEDAITAIARIRPKAPPSIDERFAAFHAKHPEVYDRLVALCRHARSHGRRRLGIGMLWEVMRWERLLDGLPDPGEDRKLNDHYRSRYARLLMEQESDLSGIFETRTLRST